MLFGYQFCVMPLSHLMMWFGSHNLMATWASAFQYNHGLGHPFSALSAIRPLQVSV